MQTKIGRISEQEQQLRVQVLKEELSQKEEQLEHLCNAHENGRKACFYMLFAAAALWVLGHVFLGMAAFLFGEKTLEVVLALIVYITKIGVVILLLSGVAMAFRHVYIWDFEKQKRFFLRDLKEEYMAEIKKLESELQKEEKTLTAIVEQKKASQEEALQVSEHEKNPMDAIASVDMEKIKKTEDGSLVISLEDAFADLDAYEERSEE